MPKMCLIAEDKQGCYRITQGKRSNQYSQQDLIDMLIHGNTPNGDKVVCLFRSEKIADRHYAGVARAAQNEEREPNNG